jgi:hypothetical protein
VTLTSGSRLGPYEVVALLGAGGMSARGARTRDVRASDSLEPLRSANALSNCGGGGVPAAQRNAGAPRALNNALRAQAALGISS